MTINNKIHNQFTSYPTRPREEPGDDNFNRVVEMENNTSILIQSNSGGDTRFTFDGQTNPTSSFGFEIGIGSGDALSTPKTFYVPSYTQVRIFQQNGSTNQVFSLSRGHQG